MGGIKRGKCLVQAFHIGGTMGKDQWPDIVHGDGTDEDQDEDEEEDDEDAKDVSTKISNEVSGQPMTDQATTLTVSSSWVSDSVNMSMQWLDRICGITPTTKRGQNIYMAFMLVIPLIPIIALITQNVILLNDVIIRQSDLVDSDASVERSDEASKLVLGLQKERSETLFSLFVKNNIETQFGQQIS